MSRIAPTKTNLLRLQGDLMFAKQGQELLDQKRNILIMELLALVDQAVEFEVGEGKKGPCAQNVKPVRKTVRKLIVSFFRKIGFITRMKRKWQRKKQKRK